MQLSFEFVSVDVNRPPAMSRYRRRLAKVASTAYRLATLRAERRHLAEPPVRSLSAAAAPGLCEPARTPRRSFAMTAEVAQIQADAMENPISAVALSAGERHKVEALARRVARLSISRRDPEFFYCERSEIVDALKQIARRY